MGVPSTGAVDGGPEAGQVIDPSTEPVAGDPAGDDVSDRLDVSFRRFVGARWNGLTRYAFILTGDHHAAEDVVQAALEKCWPKWGQIQAPAREGYVRVAIAHTAASRGRRRRLPESSLETLQAQAPHIVAALAAPGDVAEEQALRLGLWLALAELPPRRRAIVVLRLLEDQSEAETARVLGISAGAVKAQMSKGLSQLRASAHTGTISDVIGKGEQ